MKMNRGGADDVCGQLLERIFPDGFSDGFSDGFPDGFSEDFQDGFANGFANGFPEGFDRGAFEAACREAGVSCRDMDLYLYETFGMSWREIAYVLYGGKCV